MQSGGPDQVVLSPKARAFYRRALRVLRDAELPFLIGGAYALAFYTNIVRYTKDLDVFVRPEDAGRTLDLLAGAGCRTELTFPHWLGKAYEEDDFVDVIFSSGNGVVRVDDAWFTYAPTGEVLGEPVRLCPVEEMIWSKSYILERERYDGADINHLLRAAGTDLDWPRLLERFGPHWRVLLSHLVLFGFAYPPERTRVPDWVMEDLLRRLEKEQHTPPPDRRVCQGTLLSREQYLIDVEQWGYEDARLAPRGPMTATDIGCWTAAIDGEK
jgi:hypothetical protein